MKLIIHRGTKEIGGSCVELQSKETRIIIDLGMPLVNAQNQHFNSRLLEGKSIPELIDSHVLPSISGLYIGEEKAIDAVLISHAHQDHYGLLRYINPAIPVFMSQGAQALIEASDLFIPTKANPRNVTVFEKWKSFNIGDLSITPYLVDHSAFDAVAFLIKGEEKKILYSGDFRGHGRKRILFDNMILHPIKNIDYLLLEGSMLGRGEGQYQDERAVEDKMVSMFKDKQNIAFVFCSSQNIDRIVSIYRAVKHTGQTLVINLYTAYILNSLKSISDNLPQYWWPNVRVIYFKYHAETLVNSGLKSFLNDCMRSKIEKKDLNLSKKKIVLIARDNYDFKELLSHIDDFTGAQAIYSLWEGYLEDSDLGDRLKQKGISLESVHTSGHATERDLQKLAKAFSPRCLIPIHTFQPEKYPSLFTNVHILNDGEALAL
jgi:ribonuclease J